jgi:putative heme-binding domain-containing protein
LATDPHPLSVTYALTLPAIKGRGANAASATVDLDYNLNGVEAKWRSKNVYSAEGWDGWFPHVDSEVNQAFTTESASHRKLLNLVSRPGVLQFRSQLMLPAGKSTVRFQRNAPFHATIGSDPAVPKANAHGWFVAELRVASDGQPKLLELDLETGSTKNPIFHASCFTEYDPTMRPLPFSFFLLPWAAPYQPLKMPEGPGPDLAGGDWQRGKTLFTSEQLKCGTCHKIRGEGKEIGPDLSNLIHRDAASVLRDIKEPGASINPDYVAYKVTLRNGGELTGFVRAQSENAVRVVDADGKETVAPRADIKEMQPSSVSLMPVGLLEGLKDGQVRDLLAYLLIAEAPKQKMETPPLRSRAEVEAVLAKSTQPNSSPNLRALSITLVASKQDHGPGEHDYPAWQTNWVKLLKQAPNVNASTAWEWPTAEQFKQADVIVFYYWNHNWSPERYRDMDGFLARGGGLVILHSACSADKEPEPLAERIGLSAQPQRVKYRHGPLDLKIVTAADHPITRGLTQIHFVDETYWPMVGDASKVEVLATAEEEGKPWPMLWTFQKGKGRVFASILGHYSTTFDDPLFRVLVLRGLAWAAGEPTERFEKLATVGLTFAGEAKTK